jgi:hypothetical protein
MCDASTRTHQEALRLKRRRHDRWGWIALPLAAVVVAAGLAPVVVVGGGGHELQGVDLGLEGEEGPLQQGEVVSMCSIGCCDTSRDGKGKIKGEGRRGWW